MAMESYKLKGIISKIYDSISEGLTDSEIARKFDIDHSTVYYYRKKEQALRNTNIKKKKIVVPKMHFKMKPVKQIKKLKPVVEFEKEIKEHEPRHITKSYMEIQQEEETKRLKRISHCEHCNWVRKCSKCGAILESDAQVNDHYFNKKEKKLVEVNL